MGKSVAKVPSELKVATTESLDQIAARIRGHYAEFLSHRWLIGSLLIVARDKCKAEGREFLAWVKDESGIDKSKAEVYRLMQVGGATDAVKAVEKFNEKHREGNRRSPRGDAKPRAR
jgi:hypothetical protein